MKYPPSSLTILRGRDDAAPTRRDRLVGVVPLPRTAALPPRCSRQLALVTTRRAPFLRGMIVYRREAAFMPPTRPPAA